MTVIVMDKISVQLGSRRVLDNISWSVPAGQHWAVLGPNGSGKTTLLRIINGEVWPYGSDWVVNVLGHRLGACNLWELRKYIGWVSSSLHDRLLGQLTAMEIVLSGKFGTLALPHSSADIQHEHRQRAEEILDYFGCSELADRAYVTLSRGQQQQILLARALMSQLKLLLLDEPCAGLDFVAREKLLATIARLMERRDAPTIVYVTHHAEEILPTISHVMLLVGGRPVAQGEKQDVLNDLILSQAFGVPLRVSWIHGRPIISLNR